MHHLLIHHHMFHRLLLLHLHLHLRLCLQPLPQMNVGTTHTVQVMRPVVVSMNFLITVSYMDAALMKMLFAVLVLTIAVLVTILFVMSKKASALRYVLNFASHLV